MTPLVCTLNEDKKSTPKKQGNPRNRKKKRKSEPPPLVVWWRRPLSVSLASTLFCFLSQTRQQQKLHQQVLPLCGFALRSMTCRQPLVAPADPLHTHTHHPQAVRAALVRKWVRKCARKHARKPETCVCVVFRALPQNMWRSLWRVLGLFLGQRLFAGSLGSAHVRICEHIFEETPQHERIYSMGGNCMKKWEVQKRTIMQFNSCTAGWLPRVNGLRELCIRSLVGQQGHSCNWVCEQPAHIPGMRVSISSALSSPQTFHQIPIWKICGQSLWARFLAGSLPRDDSDLAIWPSKPRPWNSLICDLF